MKKLSMFMTYVSYSYYLYIFSTQQKLFYF